MGHCLEDSFHAKIPLQNDSTQSIHSSFPSLKLLTPRSVFVDATYVQDKVHLARTYSISERYARDAYSPWQTKMTMYVDKNTFYTFLLRASFNVLSCLEIKKFHCDLSF